MSESGKLDPECMVWECAGGARRRMYNAFGMFEDKSGRLASNEAEAEAYLWSFIEENLRVTDPKVREHTHDFDLYLPWLMQIFERHGDQPGERLSMLELQRLYMDTAWHMVEEGFLRPGPRLIGGEQPKDGYGNGYSLTAKGRMRLSGKS